MEDVFADRTQRWDLARIYQGRSGAGLGEGSAPGLEAQEPAVPPLTSVTGEYTRAIDSEVPDAQAYFDQRMQAEPPRRLSGVPHFKHGSTTPRIFGPDQVPVRLVLVGHPEIEYGLFVER